MALVEELYQGNDASVMENKTISREHSLRSELTSNDGKNVERLLWCKLCNRENRTVRTFLAHYRIEHMGVKPFVCGICDDGFNNLVELKDHHWLHRKGQRKYGRPLKHYSLSEKNMNKVKIIKNNTADNEDDLYVCDVCNQACFNQSNYDVHIQIHVSKNVYNCFICDCFFDNEVDMLHHYELHHQGLKESFTCDTCGQWFDTRGQHSNHAKKCKSTITYVCKICYKEYISLGGGKFCCNLCEQSISSLSDLKRLQKQGRLNLQKQKHL